VKAAASDQVPISLDVEGKSKVNVPADWYDQLSRTRDVYQNMKSEWRNRKGVVGISYTAGSETQPPRIILELDSESEAKEKRRGEAPERRNEVPVDVAERTSTELTGCSNYDDSGTAPNVPGGVRMTVTKDDPKDYETNTYESNGSLTPFMYDEDFDYHGYWMTAEHNVCNLYVNSVSSDGSYIGEVVLTNADDDFAIIKPASGVDALDEVVEVSDVDNGRRHEIKGTLSRDGVDYWANNDRYLFKYGYGSCYSRTKVKAIGTSDEAQGDCKSYSYDHAVRFGDAESVQAGDSGTITFGKDPNSSEYLACNMINGKSKFTSSPIGKSYAFGTGGYYLRNQYGYWWGDGPD
jgi:hypothetical protein